MKLRDFFDLVVVEIKENQIWQAYQIFYFLDTIMLQIKQPKSFLALKQWHMREFSLVEVESFRI